MVVISLDVMFEEVTAAARALYAAVRSVVCCVVGELVYRASNWSSRVVSPLRVVPEAKAVTRLSSNEASAERLLGESPSLERVWKSARIVANSPMVVPDTFSIVRMSLRSCSSALVRVEFEELDEPSSTLAETVDDPVEPVVEEVPELEADGHVLEVVVPVPVVVVLVPELDVDDVSELELDVLVAAALVIAELVVVELVLDVLAVDVWA
jgi:hypothetical protein